jgi:hypothetical protein
MGMAARSQQSIGTGLPLPNGLHALAPSGFPLAFSNPACRDSGFYIAGSVSRLHNLSGLSHRFAGIALDAGNLRWSLFVLQDGSRHFQRQQLGFSLANRIDKRTVLGLGLSTEALRQRQFYPERARLFIRAGLLRQIGQKTDLGMRLYTGLAKRNSVAPPQIWHLALGHRVSAQLVLFAELEAQSGSGATMAMVRTALAYQLNPNLRLHLGTGSRMRPYSVCLAWKSRQLQTTIGFDYHRILGFTPQCAWVWKGKN